MTNKRDEKIKIEIVGQITPEQYEIIHKLVTNWGCIIWLYDNNNKLIGCQF